MEVDTKIFSSILDNAKNVVIVGHFNPDGDSIGSVTAMFHYLASRGLDATMILPSDYPESLAFLDPGLSIIIAKSNLEAAEAAIAGADTILCLDFNKLARTEYLEKAISESSAKKVLIDHHIAPRKDQFDLVISETEISSACELLFWVIYNMPEIAGEIGRIPAKCAESLYSGMMTDTNNFNNSVFPSTFEMASLLLARGVDKDGLQEKILHCYTVDRTRLMGHLLKDKMVYMPAEETSYMLLSIKEKEQYNFKRGDSEGFVNLPLAISSVRISALFTEDDSREYIRVSLRSKGNTDVNLLSNKYFNGGGHKNAAGGRLYMPLEEVPAYFEKSLREWIKNSPEEYEK